MTAAVTRHKGRVAGAGLLAVLFAIYVFLYV